MKIMELNEKELMTIDGGKNKFKGNGGGSWGDEECGRDWGGYFKGLSLYLGSEFLFGKDKDDPSAIAALREYTDNHYKSKAQKQMRESRHSCKRKK